MRPFITVNYEDQQYKFNYEDIQNSVEEAEKSNNSQSLTGGYAKILEIVKVSKTRHSNIGESHLHSGAVLRLRRKNLRKQKSSGAYFNFSIFWHFL